MTPSTTHKPVPARVIVQLDPASFGPDVPAGTRVTTGHSAVEFRTASDAVVPRVTLAGVDRISGGLRLRLRAIEPGTDLALRLPPRIDTPPFGPALRLFVDAATYRTLTRAPVRAVWTDDGPPHTLEDAVRPTGFDVADALLPADPREPDAVRLLTEWAVCPEKFQFVDVAAPDSLPLNSVGLRLDLLFAGDLAVPWVRIGCVPAVNRRVVELPPVPLRGGDVRLDVDPLSEVGPSRVVMDVLRARAVRGGRTVTTYAERLAPLPPSLAVQAARVGGYALRREGDATWLTLTDRRPAMGGRTLLVRAACCRRALPEGPIGFATGVQAVTAVRPPLWPTGNFAGTDLCELLPAIAASFGGPAIGRVTCRQVPATVELPAGTARGLELQMALGPGSLPADVAYLLAQVIDHAAASASPVDAFTRVVVVTDPGNVIATCPPRAGRFAMAGSYAVANVRPFSDGPEGRASTDQTSSPARVNTRSAEQRVTLMAGFAAVTRPTSVVSLAAVLRHLLGVPVQVVPFVPARAGVPVDAQLRLGTPGRRLGPKQATWGVRVEIGPLDLRNFQRFSPGTRASRRVRALLDATVGPAAVVRPILRDVPAWRLGEGRLGRTLWVGSSRAESEGN